MSALLTKFGFPQTVGLYNDGATIHACQVGFSPFGERVRTRVSEPIGSDGEEAALEHLLDQLPSSQGMPFAVGVPTEHCYFATRPVASGGGQAAPQVLLNESLRCPNTAVDKMLVDVVNSRPDKREVASIVACSHEYLDAIREPLEQHGHRLVTAEPAPAVLHRLAEKQDRRSGKAKVVVRIFLSQAQMLVVFSANGHPIAWRQITLSRGDEAGAILAATRSLATVAKPSGVDREPDVVVVHGRYDLYPLLDIEWIGQELGVPFHWKKRPGLDGPEIAQALAMAAMKRDNQQFDLAHQYRGRPSLMQVFPWREAALYVVVLLVMAGLLWNRSREVTAEHEAIVAMTGGTNSRPLNELQNEKSQLEAQVAAAQRFVDTRVVWTRYLRDIAANLPQNIQLTSLHGDAEFKKSSRKSKKQAKKSLVIKGSVLMSETGSIPHEIDRFLNMIREHPGISGDFPVIKLADLKQFQEDDQMIALFTVICMPKQRKKG